MTRRLAPTLLRLRRRSSLDLQPTNARTTMSDSASVERKEPKRHRLGNICAVNAGRTSLFHSRLKSLAVVVVEKLSCPRQLALMEPDQPAPTAHVHKSRRRKEPHHGVRMETHRCAQMGPSQRDQVLARTRANQCAGVPLLQSSQCAGMDPLST